MQRMFWSSLAIALLMSPATYGQSLGDTARENRDKREAEEAAGTAPKVITNKDLPKDPNANPDSPGTKPGAGTPASSASDGSAEQRSADQRSVQQRLAEQRAGDQWKRQILAQKNRMVNLQARIDQLYASIQSAGGSVQYESPVNRYQARQLQRVAQLQQQLDEQKWKLDQMQEAAQRAGMHSAVYDP
ncbi:MAG TPA: hypothetical protein VJX69_07250 [Terriglobales bacterium]|nr:hypothetical protein [Terriglobales bacterium]